MRQMGFNINFFMSIRLLHIDCTILVLCINCPGGRIWHELLSHYKSKHSNSTVEMYRTSTDHLERRPCFWTWIRNDKSQKPQLYCTKIPYLYWST